MIKFKPEVIEDKVIFGGWKVEYFGDDGECYIAVFLGPKAKLRAEDYVAALKTIFYAGEETRTHVRFKDLIYPFPPCNKPSV